MPFISPRRFRTVRRAALPDVPPALKPDITLKEAALSAWHLLCRYGDDLPGVALVIAELEIGLGMPHAPTAPRPDEDDLPF